jgi:hypothetical protein
MIAGKRIFFSYGKQQGLLAFFQCQTPNICPTPLKNNAVMVK